MHGVLVDVIVRTVVWGYTCVWKYCPGDIGGIGPGVWGYTCVRKYCPGDIGGIGTVVSGYISDINCCPEVYKCSELLSMWYRWD